MKMNERYERVFGVPGRREKKDSFFLFFMAQGVFLGSFFFTMFINLHMRNALCHSSGYFMNIMKIYEDGLYKGTFREPLSIEAVFMNFAGRLSSYMFINGGGI